MNETSKIWTQQGFIANDPWRLVESEADIPAEGDIVVPLERLSAVSEELGLSLGKETGGNTRRVGVVLAPDDDLEALAGRLDQVSLIALDFPKFSDGRAFSHAARLRGHYEYKGELRAIGDVLIDQIPMMLRVGFTSFSVSHSVTLKRLKENWLTGVSRHYQPSALPAKHVQGYSWRRVSA